MDAGSGSAGHGPAVCLPAHFLTMRCALVGGRVVLLLRGARSFAVTTRAPHRGGRRFGKVYCAGSQALVLSSGPNGSTRNETPQVHAEIPVSSSYDAWRKCVSAISRRAQQVTLTEQ